MRVDDAPQWLQNLVADKALGFLEAEEQGETVRVESVSDETAEIRVGGFLYRACRKEQQIA